MEDRIIENKIAALLGFAQKAGKIVSGDDVVYGYLQKGKVKLVLAATDTGVNTKKEFVRMINKTDIPWAVWGDKARLGLVIGKSPRALVGLTEGQFAQAILALLPRDGQRIKEEWFNG